MLQRFRRFRRDCTGSNLLEAGIVTPLLLLLTFGIIDFASMFYAYLTLENGVSQATRFAITNSTMNDEDGNPLSREASIIAAMKDATPTMNVDDMAFTFTHLAPNSTSWASGAGGPGDVGRVSVSYVWTPMTPVLRPLLTDGYMTISAESAMKNESSLDE